MTKGFQITGGIFSMLALLLLRNNYKDLSIIFLFIAILAFLGSLIAHFVDVKREKLKLVKDLEQQSFDSVISHYKTNSNLKPIIDTFLDLTVEQQADLYDKAYKFIKKRESHKNPYRT